jgi:hypothetical protein
MSDTTTATAPVKERTDLEITGPMSPEVADRNAMFNLAQRRAKALMSSDLIPRHHQGKIGNMVIICQIADRIGMEPLMVAQNLFVIQGRPTWSSSFLLALIRASKLYRSFKFNFRDLGETKVKLGQDKEITFVDRECWVSAVETSTGELVEGPPVSLMMAYREGWITKDGSKWQTMPELMMRYRAAAFFARTVCPEVMFGFYSQDEIEDALVMNPKEEKEYRRPRLHGVDDKTEATVLEP